MNLSEKHSTGSLCQAINISCYFSVGCKLRMKWFPWWRENKGGGKRVEQHWFYCSSSCKLYTGRQAGRNKNRTWAAVAAAVTPLHYQMSQSGCLSLSSSSLSSPPKHSLSHRDFLASCVLLLLLFQEYCSLSFIAIVPEKEYCCYRLHVICIIVHCIAMCW